MNPIKLVFPCSQLFTVSLSSSSTRDWPISRKIIPRAHVRVDVGNFFSCLRRIGALGDERRSAVKCNETQQEFMARQVIIM